MYRIKQKSIIVI